MKVSTLVIGILWLCVVGSAVVDGFNCPNSQLAQNWSAIDTETAVAAMLLLPLMVILMAFRKRDVPAGTPKWVSSFLNRIKLELLLGTYGLIDGIIGLIRSVQLGGPRGAFVLSGFFASGGVALLIVYIVLRRRGLVQ
jgi:hypothetical protein